ncbi:MAG: hypothetical protein ACJAZD_003233 [Ilumatobacter sp.]|jgi:hypothetical protein
MHDIARRVLQVCSHEPLEQFEIGELADQDIF